MTLHYPESPNLFTRALKKPRTFSGSKQKEMEQKGKSEKLHVCGPKDVVPDVNTRETLLGAKGSLQLTARKEVGPHSTNCKELKSAVNQNERGSPFFLRTSHKSTPLGTSTLVLEDLGQKIQLRYAVLISDTQIWCNNKWIFL